MRDQELIELGMRHKRVDIDRSTFQKTETEKRVLNIQKRDNRRSLRDHGLNRLKQMNTSSPIHLKSSDHEVFS